MAEKHDGEPDTYEVEREEARMRVIDESMMQSLGRRVYGPDGRPVPFINAHNPPKQDNDYDPHAWAKT